MRLMLRRCSAESVDTIFPASLMPQDMQDFDAIVRMVWLENTSPPSDAMPEKCFCHILTEEW